MESEVKKSVQLRFKKRVCFKLNQQESLNNRLLSKKAED